MNEKSENITLAIQNVYYSVFHCSSRQLVQLLASNVCLRGKKKNFVSFLKENFYNRHYVNVNIDTKNKGRLKRDE